MVTIRQRFLGRHLSFQRDAHKKKSLLSPLQKTPIGLKQHWLLADQTFWGCIGRFVALANEALPHAC